MYRQDENYFEKWKQNVKLLERLDLKNDGTTSINFRVVEMLGVFETVLCFMSMKSMEVFCLQLTIRYFIIFYTRSFHITAIFIYSVSGFAEAVKPEITLQRKLLNSSLRDSPSSSMVVNTHWIPCIIWGSLKWDWSVVCIHGFL